MTRIKLYTYIWQSLWLKQLWPVPEVEIEFEIMSGIIWSTPRLQYPSLIQNCLNNLRLILDYFLVSDPSISFRYWNPGLILNWFSRLMIKRVLHWLKFDLCSICTFLFINISKCIHAWRFLPLFLYLIEIINLLAYCYGGVSSLRFKSTLRCRSILAYAITSNQTIKQAWIPWFHVLFTR